MRIDCAVVGAQKAGTTSLTHYLSQFSGVSTQSSFEFPYFARDDFFARGLESAIASSFEGRVADVANTDRLVAIKSVGIMYLPWAAERLHNHNPECKVIVCIREPVSRAYSAYWYLVSTGQETAASFEEALEMEPARLSSNFNENHHFAYVDRGRYLPQVERLVELFGYDRVHIVRSAELRAEPLAELGRVADFLGGAVKVPNEIDLGSRNATTASRSRIVARALRTPAGITLPRPVRATGRRAKAAIGRFNRTPDFKPQSMNDETRLRLTDLLAPDNEAFIGKFPNVGGVETW